jgi:iron complex transport system ATP-binding protein
VTAALELTAVSAHRAGRAVLSEVSLAVEAGEMLGLVGPNGAGKTTLLRAALGLQKRSAGAVSLAGRPLEALSEGQRAAAVGYLPQERRVAWNMPAEDVAALGAAGLAPHDGLALARACLEELEVANLARRGVLDMSGGERARVLLARLLATRARLLVADEPAAGLDPEAQLLILERLRQRAAGGAAVIVTSHDLTLAARACDRIAVLHGGRLHAIGAPSEALSPAVLAEVFALEGGLIASPAGLTLAARRRGPADSGNSR